MVKTLIKHGNSYALIIDKAILDLLRITPETPLELTTDGHTLIITPVRQTPRQKAIRESLARIDAKYGHDLKRMAEG